MHYNLFEKDYLPYIVFFHNMILGGIMYNYLMDDLKKGISIKEIAYKYCFNSEKRVGELIRNLQNMGALIEKKCDINGNIYFILNNNINDEISIDGIEDFFRFLIISDLHIGSNMDGIKYMNKVYNYAIKKDIHHIFILGDLFEGAKENSKYSLIEKQTKIFFDNYPFKSNIINYVLFGNHDYSFLNYLNVDVSKIINSRPDVVFLVTGLGKIKLFDNYFAFQHDLVITKPSQDIGDYKLLFAGHSHKFEICDNKILVPALATGKFYNNIISTGFLDVELLCDNNIKCCINHLIFNNDIKLLNQIYLNDIRIKVKKKI